LRGKWRKIGVRYFVFGCPNFGPARFLGGGDALASGGGNCRFLASLDWLCLAALGEDFSEGG